MSDNLIGKGFQHQTGASCGLDGLRPADESARGFNYGLPGSGLPLPTKPLTQNGSVSATGDGLAADVGSAVAEGLTVAIALSVQDSFVRNVASPDTGVDYPAGSVAVKFKDEDVSFRDQDVLWEPHDSFGTNGTASPSGVDATADVGTPALSGVAAYTATGDAANADVGTAVARGAGAVSVTGDVLNADAGTPTVGGAGVAAPGGDVGAADVGTAALAGAAAYSASGDQLDADVGSATAAGETVYLLADLDSYVANVSDAPDLSQSGDIAVNATGDELAADVGTAVLSGQAQTSATGDELAADVGIPTIGGAGIAVPGGDVGQADVGSAATSGSANFAPTGDELTADVGDVSVSTQYILDIYDAANVNAADAPTLTLQNGEASPAGVEANADAGTAVASAPSIVVPVAPRGGRRRPVQWELWEQPREKEAPEPSISAVAYPMGVAAQSALGVVAVNAASNIIPMADFGRSRVGVVVAAVDYTLRDQQEEELIQILLAA